MSEAAPLGIGLDPLVQPVAVAATSPRTAIQRTSPFCDRQTAAMTSGYSGTPLSKKLGINAESRVLLRGAPDGFALAPPDGAVVHRRPGRGPYDVILLFCRDRAALTRGFATERDRLTVAGGLWVCWPKRASGVVTDLGESAVREHGLDCGLVDVKIAAVDETWSALRFVRRLADRN